EAADTEVEATSVLPSLNVKTTRSWRGIFAFTHLAREGRMTVTIGRRELLAALGGAAVAWSMAALAEGKRLGLVRELVPTGALIAVLLNPSNANFQTQLRDVTDAARTVGQQVRVLNASNEGDIHAAFATLNKLRAAGLLVGGDPFFNTRREQLVTLANHYAIPRSMRCANLLPPAA